MTHCSLFWDFIIINLADAGIIIQPGAIGRVSIVIGEELLGGLVIIVGDHGITACDFQALCVRRRN